MALAAFVSYWHEEKEQEEEIVSHRNLCESEISEYNLKIKKIIEKDTLRSWLDRRNEVCSGSSHFSFWHFCVDNKTQLGFKTQRKPYKAASQQKPYNVTSLATVLCTFVVLAILHRWRWKVFEPKLHWSVWVLSFYSMQIISDRWLFDSAQFARQLFPSLIHGDTYLYCSQLIPQWIGRIYPLLK